MPSFNRVLLMGNLTRDPALKYLPSQTAVAEFGLAINRKWRTDRGEDREEVTFVDCSAFGKTAETINKYFAKGHPIFIEGRLKFDQWEDRNGGGKRSRLTVVVEHFTFIGSRDDGNRNRGDSAGAGNGAGEPRGESRRPDANAEGDAPPFKEDDIPF